MDKPSSLLKLQSMPPKQARLCLSVEYFLLEELQLDIKDKTIIVACSGGGDSMALVAILLALAPRNSLSLHVAHLDHGLRPESAMQATEIQQFCHAVGLPSTFHRVDVAAETRGRGLEETARKIRYNFFYKVRQEQNAAFIATGHQINDLGEDVLMRLLRGSGWPQLGGMSAFVRQTGLIRPLLLTPREDLFELVNVLSLPIMEDSSNTDTRFLRNRIRHTLLPLFIQENPKFLRSIGSLWRLACQDREYFQLKEQETRTTLPDLTFLPRQELLLLHPTLRLRIFKSCLDALGPGQALASTLHKLDRVFSQGRVGVAIQFPGNKKAYISLSGIEFIVSPSRK